MKENKEELQAKLREIERQEEVEKNESKKKKNFERFMERSPDYMVGKAHCEMDFINKRYASDRQQAVIPVCVTISGNCSKSYYPLVDITDSTKTFFHNVWEYADEKEFQNELNAIVQKYVDKYSKKLHNVLEMMGLQSLHYYATKEFFTEEDLPKVKREIKSSQKEILDTYSDDDFKELARHRVSYNEDSEEKVESITLDLSHSNHILKTYITENRPHLLEDLGFHLPTEETK